MKYSKNWAPTTPVFKSFQLQNKLFVENLALLVRPNRNKEVLDLTTFVHVKPTSRITYNLLSQGKKINKYNLYFKSIIKFNYSLIIW